MYNLIKIFNIFFILNIYFYFTKRKDKLTCCMTITEGICSPTVKIAAKFPHVLSLSIETLLILCNDDESDVRMVADETLNKIIRV